MTGQSFADPETHFRIIYGDEDDGKPNVPTGEIECDACGAISTNIDEIDHAEDCPQRNVHSRWWRHHHN